MTLLAAATALALSLAFPAAASDHDACLDAACDLQVLYDADNAPSGAAGSTAIAAKKLGRWGIDTDGMDTLSLIHI